MKSAINRLGDTMLGKLLPGTTARADTCWRLPGSGLICCIKAGITYCKRW